jgi:hypothetical protein
LHFDLLREQFHRGGLHSVILLRLSNAFFKKIIRYVYNIEVTLMEEIHPIRKMRIKIGPVTKSSTSKKYRLAQKGLNVSNLKENDESNFYAFYFLSSFQF